MVTLFTKGMQKSGIIVALFVVILLAAASFTLSGSNEQELCPDCEAHDIPECEDGLCIELFDPIDSICNGDTCEDEITLCSDGPCIELYDL